MWSEKHFWRQSRCQNCWEMTCFRSPREHSWRISWFIQTFCNFIEQILLACIFLCSRWGNEHHRIFIFRLKPIWEITAINQIFKHFWHSWSSLAPSFRGIPSLRPSAAFPVSSLINSRRALTFLANFNQRQRRRSINSTINSETNSLHYQFSSAFPIETR